MIMNRRRFTRSLAQIPLGITGVVGAKAAVEHQTTTTNTPFETKKKHLQPPLLFPAPLFKGATIGIVAPASGVSQEELNSGIKSLESLGCTVVVGKSIFRGASGFFSAPDEVRAAEFMEFVQRDDIHAIICARGGYGVMRILPLLDFELIRKKAKIIMGFSDITALLNAIYLKSHLITFHGPVASGEYDDFTRHSVFRTLFAEIPDVPEGEEQEPEKSRKKSKGEKKRFVLSSTHIVDFPAITTLPVYADDSLLVIGKGKAEGRLVGGNLTMLCATLGTPFEIQTINTLLFLEDVREEPYKIDRMLTQLWLASKLQQCAGIILGKFTKSESGAELTPSYTLEEVLRFRLEPLGIPVVCGFQFGHVRSQFPLPIGALARLDADAKTLSLVEKPVAKL